LADQVVVRARIMLPDFFGGMGNVELDRPTAARPEVYEEWPFHRTEQIARMRLAVQQLLASAPAIDRATQSTERVPEELPVGTEQRWSALSVANLSLRTGDSIGQVRRPEMGLAQGGMQSDKCVRILGWRGLRFRRLVVSPERDSEAIPQMDTVFTPGVKLSHRAIDFGETASNLHLELGASLMR
jgi:hypothetical protein